MVKDYVLTWILVICIVFFSPATYGADSKNNGEYSGSQAFNNFLPSIESVNPSTGTFGASKSLINQAGINEGVNLNLNLMYSHGSSGILGLPQNWIFDIAYVIPGASLTYHGKTFIIDTKYTWADMTGYKSGLRYINNHGLKFETCLTNQPLPSGEAGSYKYCLTTGDGSHDYFDATGKLVEHDDRFGNYISYAYVNQLKGVVGNYLKHIKDSFGQIFDFLYKNNSIILNSPNESQTTLSYSSSGIVLISDSINNQTRFRYDPSGNIISISYPTGLKSYINYKVGGMPYKDLSGNVGSFPAVFHIRRMGMDGNVLSWTRYEFGAEIRDYSFTGYPFYSLSSMADGLIESKDTDYQYEVLIAQMDATGQNYLAKQRTYYNYLHLPIRSKQYLDPCESSWYQTDLTYACEIGNNWHARSTNYNKPVRSVSSIHLNGAKILLNQSATTYDNYGNLVSSQQDLYDSSQSKFIPQTRSISVFNEVSWGKNKIEMPESVTVQDLTTGYQRQTRYTLSQDTKNIGSKAIHYGNQENKDWSPWKTTHYTYDDQGRLTSTELAWSPGTQPDPDSIQSTSYQISYNYDHANSKLTVTHIDALGYETKMDYDSSTPGSPLIQVTSPLGQKVNHKYDPLGRLKQITDAKGNVYTIDYTLAGTDGTVNSVITTDPMGYKKATYLDELGRMIKVMDNGDPTKPYSPDVTRVLKTKTYKSGQIVQTTNILGLATTFEYDFLGRPIKATDPMENVSTTEYDEATLSVLTYLNGELAGKSTKDGLGRTVLTESYPDSSDQTISYFMRSTAQYNGLGQSTQSTISSVVKETGEPTVLTQSNNLRFDPDGNVIEKQSIGYNSQRAKDSVMTSSALDLLGNPLHGTKVVSYSSNEKKYTVNSDKIKYNRRGNIVSITDALLQEEKNSYDPDGRLQTHTRFDGTVFTYEYDDNDNIKTISWEENGTPYSTSHTYYNDNSPQSISDANATINYGYYLDGTAKSVQYPHGTQQYGRDQYSRLATQVAPPPTNTPHNTIIYTYNSNTGQVESVKQGSEGLTYTYGEVNHQKGVVTGMQLSRQKPWIYQYQFNGWGQLSLAQVQEEDPVTQVLNITRSYDERGRINTFTKFSAAPDKNMNFTKSYTYDGLSQLTSSKTTYTDRSPSIEEEYTYDGNNNVLTRKETGSPDQSFTYNAVDQLTTPNITYDTNGRITKDDQGNSYVYNEQDELIKVVSPVEDVLVSYTYYPDGLLQDRTEGKTNHQEFFYDGGTVNAVSTGVSGTDDQSWTNFLFNGQERIGAYEQKQQSLYYVAANGSTGATVEGDTTTGLDYKPYGTPQQPAPSLPANKSFTWNQEYVDPATNLVYLRTRFYNPRLMRFMSRDTMPLYNKYAFGNGDPINMIDPTGMMPWGLQLFTDILLDIAGLITLPFIPVSAPLLAAGISGTVYTATHHDSTNSDSAWGTMVGVGAAVGFTAPTAAVATALIPQVLGPEAAFLASIAAGAADGALQGYLQNGLANTNAGHPFNEGAGLAAGMGAFFGAVGGTLGGAGGLASRGVARRTLPLASAMVDDFIDIDTPALSRLSPRFTSAYDGVYGSQTEGISFMEGMSRPDSIYGDQNATDLARIMSRSVRNPHPARDAGFIAVHGTRDGAFFTSAGRMTPRQLANTPAIRALLERTAGGGGKPIYLYSCYADLTAQQLANALGRRVLIPTGTGSDVITNTTFLTAREWQWFDPVSIIILD